jgi:multicomponent Na+:H+ antiporter subunit C
MNGPFIFMAAGLVLLHAGLYALLTARHVLRRILAANVLGTGIFIVLVAQAARAEGQPPDPVPHALVLTGIVVAAAATGLGLTLIRRLQRESAVDVHNAR